MNRFIMLLSISLMASWVSGQDIQLPAPDRTGGKPLMQALNERQSNRSFQDKSLTQQQLSDLLWAANGFNRDDKRTAPTANNRQELELYAVTKEGVFFYDAKNNLLKEVKGITRSSGHAGLRGRGGAEPDFRLRYGESIGVRISR